MVNWLKAMGDNFTVDYLLASLYFYEDLTVVGCILSSYGYEHWNQLDYVKEMVIDYISYRKIDVFGDN